MNVEIDKHVLRRVIEALSEQDTEVEGLDPKLITVISHGGAESDLMKLVRAYNGAIVTDTIFGGLL